MFLFNLYNFLRDMCYHYPHFIAQETEAWRNEVTSPRSHTAN